MYRSVQGIEYNIKDTIRGVRAYIVGKLFSAVAAEGTLYRGCAPRAIHNTYIYIYIYKLLAAGRALLFKAS